MKAFIFSTLAIVTLIILSLIYSVYICKLINDIIDLANSLPENGYLFTQHDAETVSKIRACWDKHDTIFHLFIDDEHHTTAELALSALEQSMNGGDFNNYIWAKSTFISTLDDLILIEGRGFFSIF